MTDLELLEHLAEELSQQPTKRAHAGALQRLMAAKKPTVYLSDQEDRVILSALSEDDPEAEKYFTELVSLRITGKLDSTTNTMTILRNVLERAGVTVVLEY